MLDKLPRELMLMDALPHIELFELLRGHAQILQSPRVIAALLLGGVVREGTRGVALAARVGPLGPLRPPVAILSCVVGLLGAMEHHR